MPFDPVILPPAHDCISRLHKKYGTQFTKPLAKTLNLLAENPQHPGLQTHGLQGYAPWKESYITRNYRIIWRLEGRDILIAWCGTHAELDKNTYNKTLVSLHPG